MLIQLLQIDKFNFFSKLINKIKDLKCIFINILNHTPMGTRRKYNLTFRKCYIVGDYIPPTLKKLHF